MTGHPPDGPLHTAWVRHSRRALRCSKMPLGGCNSIVSALATFALDMLSRKVTNIGTLLPRIRHIVLIVLQFCWGGAMLGVSASLWKAIHCVAAWTARTWTAWTFIHLDFIPVGIRVTAWGILVRHKGDCRMTYTVDPLGGRRNVVSQHAPRSQPWDFHTSSLGSSSRRWTVTASMCDTLPMTKLSRTIICLV